MLFVKNVITALDCDAVILTSVGVALTLPVVTLLFPKKTLAPSVPRTVKELNPPDTILLPVFPITTSELLNLKLNPY